ncbi:MAG: MFS transporter [Chloroflexota bacterium]|nr:MFS transporter [Chloroflexota bacterium]
MSDEFEVNTIQSKQEKSGFIEAATFKVYGYRWVVILVYMFAIIINQLLWITFAPITGEAATFYSVSDLSIALLSMSFMVVYIIVSIPASWVIDNYGIRVGVGIGAALTGIFGLMRGLVADNYTLVLVAQIGIAIGQPFILNAITKVAARWFPLQERATASGFGSLAIYLGIAVGMFLTPFMTLQGGIENMLLAYGIVAVAAAVLFIALAKEHPPTPPCPPEMDERSLVFDGLRNLLRLRDFLMLMVIFFVGLGTFNAVTTWVEDIVRPRGFTITQAGIIGGLMVVGGILGALIVPALSDRYRKRKVFIVLTLVGATLGLAGVTFSPTYALTLVSAFVLGFSLLSAGPIGFQYGAEIGFPAPEGTSNGLLLMMGQISGIAFILAMDALKDPGTGSMTLSLVVLIVLMLISLLISTQLKESTLISDQTLS